MVDTSVVPSLGYVQVVPRRDAATLLPIIQQHVQPGTVIWSDQWAAYNQVGRLAGVASHDTVNYSVAFFSTIWCSHTDCEKLLEPYKAQV